MASKKEIGVNLEIVQPEEKELKVIGKARTKVPNLAIEAKKEVKDKTPVKKTTAKKAPAKKTTPTKKKTVEKEQVRTRRSSAQDKELEK